MTTQGMGRRLLPSGVDPDAFPMRVRRFYGGGRGHIAWSKKMLHKGERRQGLKEVRGEW